MPRFNRPSRCRTRRNSTRRYQYERLEARQLLANDLANELAVFNDEFDDSATLSQWQQIHEVEGWNADHLQTYDINQTHPGRMTMVSHTTSWYQDRRGPLSFKEIRGDFLVTTQVYVTDRDDVGGSDPDDIPGDSSFSLGGIMIRTPRDIQDPDTDWVPGTMLDDGTNTGENFVFLSLGHGATSNMTLELKNTRNSDSQISLIPFDTNTAELRLSRIENTVTAMYRLPGEELWQLAGSFHRPDMPETLQIGLVSYTNYEKVEDFEPFYQNSHVLSAATVPAMEDPTPLEPFNPDIEASFEYIRFARPATDSAGPMQVGVNLEYLVDWTPGMPFKDAFLKSRPWSAMAFDPSLGYWTFQSTVGGGPELSVDDHGWVTELASWTDDEGQLIQQGAQSMIFSAGANSPEGTYTLEWDGEGALQIGNTLMISQGLTADGSHFAEIELPASTEIWLLITETNPADPIRNIDFWMPNPEGASFAGQNWDPADATSPSPFLPSYLAKLEGITTLRFMDWMNTNFTNVTTWGDRRRFDDATQSDGVIGPGDANRGVAIEYMIALANELDADMWVNMPAQADDEYVESFATLVRDTLDSDWRVYVEYGNEVWNSLFAVNQWLNASAAEAGVDFFQQAAAEIRNDFEIWSSVFAGQTERVTRVVAGQAANPWIAGQLLANLDGQFDAVSATAYAGIGPEQVATFTDLTTAADIVQSILDESIPWALNAMQQHATLANQYSSLLDRDIELLAYESGSHVFGLFSGMDQSPAVNAAIEASNGPAMYDVYTTLLNGMQEIGLDLYNEFTFIDHRGPSLFGAYGLIESQFTKETTFQYQALMDFIAENSDDPEPNPGPIVLSPDGTLTIHGDESDNVLMIEDLGNGSVEVILVVAAMDEKLLFAANDVTRIHIDLAGGDDEFEFVATNVVNPISELHVALGSGKDEINVRSRRLEIAGRTNWNIQAEQITLSLEHLTVQTTGAFGMAISEVQRLDRNLHIASIAGSYTESIEGTAEADSFSLRSNHVSIASNGVINGHLFALGGNDYVADDLYHLRNEGTFVQTYDLGVGDDAYDGWRQDMRLVGVTDLRINGDEGNDRIFSYATALRITQEGQYDFHATGGSGNDLIRMSVSDARVDGNLDMSVSGGDGDDLLCLLAAAQNGSKGSVSAVVDGDAGNDLLGLEVRVPKGLDELFAELDGGDGFDIGWATKNVTVHDCEG